MRFASIGECMLELSDQRDSRWTMGFAGDALNTAWYVRALLPEAEVHFVSAFGDDAFSDQQRDFLRRAGIGTASSPTIPGARPGLYAIALDGGERSFTYWRSDSAARRLASDPAALDRSLAGCDIAYFTGITLAILAEPDREVLFAALENARANGARIAFDPNHRLRLWPDDASARLAYARAFALADIALPTFEDLAEATPDAAARRLHGAGVAEIVVKCGAAPAYLLTGQGHAEIPATQVETIDTTGAGDSFCGGYLAGRLAGLSPQESARQAHRVAAQVVARHGALIDLQ
ncbi:sugar kinase [Falsirhodobacter xinxiangensis]|uniref:sugar kinase n=1 Tax=Falsirhodobacter xinxiangensis TaxID=2530049 RepID=UPI0010A9C028|nr:sugar kinase [Rhodobacter xinxiangensis]